jgi:TetR/AcrR family transcriptional regulator
MQEKLDRMPPQRILRTSANPEQQERAIIAAATDEFARVGVRRANIDDVAKRSGVSRSTLYRRFPNKDELLLAVVRDATGVILQRLVTVTDNLSPQQAVIEVFCAALQEVRTNPLLARLVTSEPDIFESLLGFVNPGLDSILESVATTGAQTLRRLGATMPEKDLRTATELQIRLTTSLLSAPSRVINLDNEAAAREFATKFLASMIW